MAAHSDTDFSTETGYSGREIDHSRLSEVRRRRMLAFVADYLIISVLCLVAGAVIFVAGIFTLGAAWLLYAALFPLVALSYIALTMGGPKQATIGMQLFSIRIETLDHKRVDGLLAIVHSVIFWAAHVVLTPVMLAVSLFSGRKRLIQDILLGTVIVRSDI